MIRLESVRYLAPRPGRRSFTTGHWATCTVCAWRTRQLPSETDARRASLEHVHPKAVRP